MEGGKGPMLPGNERPGTGRGGDDDLVWVVGCLAGQRQDWKALVTTHSLGTHARLPEAAERGGQPAAASDCGQLEDGGGA